MSNKSKEKLHDYFSIVLIGDSQTGKTSILDRYCNSNFSFSKKKHSSVDVYKKTIEIKDKEYALKFWDSNCTDDKQIFQRADCIIIVCAVDNKDSLDNIDKWLQNLNDALDISDKTLAIIANKIDLEDERVFTSEELKEKAEQLQIDCFEVSSMESTGIDEAFEKIIQKLVINTYKDNGNKAAKVENKEDIYSSKGKCIII